MKEAVTVIKCHECQIVTKQHNIQPTKTLKVYFMMVTTYWYLWIYIQDGQKRAL